MAGDIIFLTDLQVYVHIGVTPHERRKKQRLKVSVEMEPAAGWKTMSDSIENTVDYSAVRRDIRTLLRSESFNLIETAAARIALLVKQGYGVKSVSVTVKKFPYRDAACVGCRLVL